MSKQGDGDVFLEFIQELSKLSTPEFREEFTRILSEMARRRTEEQWRAFGREPPKRFHPGDVPATTKQSDEK